MPAMPPRAARRWLTVGAVAALSAAGVATLRVERPGLGDSEGGPCEALGWWDEVALHRLVGVAPARADDGDRAVADRVPEALVHKRHPAGSPRPGEPGDRHLRLGHPACGGTDGLPRLPRDHRGAAQHRGDATRTGHGRPDHGDLGPGELCDDGNQDSTDLCTAACHPAACGDGWPARRRTTRGMGSTCHCGGSRTGWRCSAPQRPQRTTSVTRRRRSGWRRSRTR